MQINKIDEYLPTRSREGNRIRKEKMPGGGVKQSRAETSPSIRPSVHLPVDTAESESKMEFPEERPLCR